MRRWLKAAREDKRRTDKLTELTIPNPPQLQAGSLQPERLLRQYCQNVSSAKRWCYAANFAAAIGAFEGGNATYYPGAWRVRFCLPAEPHSLKFIELDKTP